MILHADRVGAVAAHVLAPRGEALVGGGHVSDERAARPRQRGGLEHLKIMLVGIAADALIAVLIRRDGDVVDRGFSRFLDGTQLGVHQQAALIDGGLGDQRVADRAIVRLLVVLLAEQLDVGQRVGRVLRVEHERFGFRLHLFDFRRNAILRRAVRHRVKRGLQVVGVGLFGQHVQEVLADQLGVDAHEQRRNAFGDEIPAVGEGLVAHGVIHEHLVERLQRQRLVVALDDHAFALGPLLRDEVEQVAGVEHLRLNLVAVLNERHGIDVVGALDVGVQRGEDGVVLRLRPFDRAGVARVDLLEHLDEARAGGLAAAGVADAVERLAVGFFNRLGIQLLVGHGLRLSDHFLHGFSHREACRHHHREREDGA